jgi:hypothetical protein
MTNGSASYRSKVNTLGQAVYNGQAWDVHAVSRPIVVGQFDRCQLGLVAEWYDRGDQPAVNLRRNDDGTWGC